MRLRISLSFLFVIGALALLAAGAPAARADIRSGDRVVIAADEVIDDDLIVSGQIVEINGTIRGDLLASATTVILNGTVDGSAALAGQTVNVSGQVGGSLYAAGYSVVLDEGAVVNRNAYLGGFSAATRPDSQVSRTLYAGGYQLLHDGFVGGDVVASVSALHINGTVGGDVRGEVSAAQPGATAPATMPFMPAEVEMLTPGLVIGPTAQIGSQVLVQETVAAAAPRTGVLGLPLWLSDRLGQLFGLLLTALLVVALAPRFLPALSDALERKPLPSLGWGALIYLLLFPAALVVGLILIVVLAVVFGFVSFGQYTLAVLGLSISFYAFALFAFLFFVYLIAWLLLGHWLGRWILSRLGLKPAGRLTQFAYVLLGVVLFQALRAVPVLGFILAFVVGTLALGAVVVYWLDRRRPVKVA